MLRTLILLSCGGQEVGYLIGQAPDENIEVVVANFIPLAAFDCVGGVSRDG